MEKTNLGHGEELVLRCKNNGGMNVRRRIMELTKPIVVNVDCTPPKEISKPQTFREAMLAGDLYAIPTAGHMYSGVQTKYLPVSHLPDGTPNPARKRLLRQRSLEREQALANMSEQQIADYKGKIAKLTGDPRLVHAKNKGLLGVYNAVVKAKEAQRKAKKAQMLAKETLAKSNAAAAAAAFSKSWGKGGRRRKSRKKRCVGRLNKNLVCYRGSRKSLKKLKKYTRKLKRHLKHTP